MRSKLAVLYAALFTPLLVINVAMAARYLSKVETLDKARLTYTQALAYTTKLRTQHNQLKELRSIEEYLSGAFDHEPISIKEQNSSVKSKVLSTTYKASQPAHASYVTLQSIIKVVESKRIKGKPNLWFSDFSMKKNSASFYDLSFTIHHQEVLK